MDGERAEAGASAVIKAYTWQDHDKGTGGVVFAKSSVEARRKGASIYGNGDFNDGYARRAKWADAYVSLDRVPLEVMLDAGWWMTCAHCETRIPDEDGEDEDGKPKNPISAGHLDFCCSDCLQLWGWEKVERARAEATTTEWLKARLLEKIPGVTVTDDKAHVYIKFDNGKPVAHQGIISFTFPGCNVGAAHYRFDKAGDDPHVTVCNGDLAAWDSWRATSSASETTPSPAVPTASTNATDGE